MATFAVIDANGNIINRVEIEDGSWTPPGNCSTIAENGSALEIGGTYVDGVYSPPPVSSMPSAPRTILSQDLMAQFTASDAVKIRAAVDASSQFWLLWSAMQAQKDPMYINNERFKQGWDALTQVLGSKRVAEIAASLGMKII